MLKNMRSSSGGTVKIDPAGKPIVASSQDLDKNRLLVNPLSLEGSPGSTYSPPDGSQDSMNNGVEMDKELNQALQHLEDEWRQGLLVSSEIIESLDTIGSSSHSRQLPNPSGVLRTIDSRAMSARKQLALSLSASCRWGIKSMLGCLGGMDAALTCVTSSQSNQILAGLSHLMDNAVIREKEAEERSKAHLVKI